MKISVSLTKYHRKKPTCHHELTYLQILSHHLLEQSPDVLLGRQKDIWRNVEYLIDMMCSVWCICWIPTNWPYWVKTKKKKSFKFNFNPFVKSSNSKREMLQYQLNCSYFISFPSVHSPYHSFHSPSSIVHLIHICHIWLHYIITQPYSHFNSSVNLVSWD